MPERAPPPPPPPPPPPRHAPRLQATATQANEITIRFENGAAVLSLGDSFPASAPKHAGTKVGAAVGTHPPAAGGAGSAPHCTAVLLLPLPQRAPQQ
jgi:hypothetical protein